MDESEDATSPSLIWEDSHTISYRYRDSTATRNSKPKEAENSKKKSEKSLLSPLIPFLSKPPLTCIPIESPLFNVLHLLSVVNALNSSWGFFFFLDDYEPLLTNRKLMVNKNLTAKANSQLRVRETVHLINFFH